MESADIQWEVLSPWQRCSWFKYCSCYDVEILTVTLTRITIISNKKTWRWSLLNMKHYTDTITTVIIILTMNVSTEYVLCYLHLLTYSILIITLINAIIIIWRKKTKASSGSIVCQVPCIKWQIWDLEPSKQIPKPALSLFLERDILII